MKRATLLVLAVAVVVNIAVLGTLFAQQDPSGATTAPSPTISTSTLSGSVVSSSDSALVVKSDDGVESTFTVDSSTVLPTSLAPGDRVSVDYHVLDGGAYHASRVASLTGSESAAPMAASATGAEPSGSSGAAEPYGATGASGTGGTGGGLPRTASALPLFAVMGVLAIGAALGVRAIFRRMRTIE